MGPIIDPKALLLLMAGALATVIVGILVFWPFVGTLVRLWARYDPKHIVLDGEGECGNLQCLISNELQGLRMYWSLFRQVKRVEVSSRISVISSVN
jgi:hypothetical protein